MKGPELRWYRVHWPSESDRDRLHALSLLLASSASAPVVIESLGRSGSVEHRIAIPAGRADGVVEQLRVAAPELGLLAVEARGPFQAGIVLDLRLTTPMRSLGSDQPELVSRAIVAALARSRPGEELLLQWQLLAALPPASVADRHEQADRLPMSIADVLFGRRGRLDGEGRRALRTKRQLPVWRAKGRLAVRASSPARERELLRELFNALRTANAPGVAFTARRGAAGGVDRLGPSWFAPLRLNTAEIVAIAGWPVGATSQLPIERSSSRALPPSREIHKKGVVLGRATSPGRERPIALSASDALRHLHVLGPTGTGKSTLLLNAITQQMAAGHAIVVIEPKGDLIEDVLARVPRERIQDVVLLDPGEIDRPVGLNPLALNARPAELVADQLLGMFRSLYESSWGPRTNDIMAASLLTLARTPGMNLCALPLLLTDEVFRRRIVGGLDDPLGLEPFWAGFEAWSDAERTMAIAPTMNRIRPFLLRPQLRAILGQSRPRLDLSQVFSQRKILLVNLAKGLIGPEAAALLGSLLLAQLWGAILGRAIVSPGRRHPAFVYIDEVQDYLRLPTDLGDGLVQARGLGVGFVLAHQHLSQLDATTRSAVLANARSRVCFQLGADDARALASEAVTSDDLRHLAVFEFYAQLVAGGAVQPWCSAQALPPTPPTTDTSRVRDESRTRYGIDRGVVEAELEKLTRQQNAADDLRPRRRRDGGTA